MIGDVFSQSRSWIAKAAAILLLLSGIIHLLIIPHHWQHAPAHGIFMGIIGVIEIIWAVVFWLKPTNILAQAGVIISVGCITLWGITRIFPAPFGQGPEEVDVSGIITKVLEGIAAIVLVIDIIQAVSSSHNRYRVWQAIIAIILLAGFLGFGAYEGARASEPFFPTLVASETHEHEELENQHSPGTEAPDIDHEHETLPAP
jgi:hypothetical protein